MTTLDPPATRTRPFELDELVLRDLAAIDSFLELRRIALSESDAMSREERMDLERRREVLDRAHEALLTRLEARQRDGEELWRDNRPTAVVAHRHAWFAGKVTELLEARGVRVLGSTVVGPEAVGWAVADQPDLVVVDDTLAMLPGRQVVRQLRRLCPHAVVAAQTATSDGVAPLLEAGASTVHVRAVPPDVVVDEALALLDQG